MRRTLLCTLAVLLVMSADAADIDRYEYFLNKGIFDPGVSNQAANSLVAEGIAADDQEIVDTTIRALGTYAGQLEEGFSGPEGPLPTRTFTEVEGLRKFLLAHWRKKLAESGYDSAEAQRRDYEQFDATLDDRPNGDQNGGLRVAESVYAYVRAAIPWPMIPKMLCVFWPGDPDVLELVWENQANNLSANVSLQTLGLLNVGRFAGPEADDFRMKQLQFALENEGALASIAVMHSAEGLAFSSSPEALPLLIAAGVKHASARTEVMIALSAWGDEQLQAHAGELRPLVKGYQSLRPMGADVEAQERLRRVLGLGDETEGLVK